MYLIYYCLIGGHIWPSHIQFFFFIVSSFRGFKMSSGMQTSSNASLVNFNAGAKILLKNEIECNEIDSFLESNKRKVEVRFTSFIIACNRHHSFHFLRSYKKCSCRLSTKRFQIFIIVWIINFISYKKSTLLPQTFWSWSRKWILYSKNWVSEPVRQQLAMTVNDFNII